MDPDFRRGDGRGGLRHDSHHTDECRLPAGAGLRADVLRRGDRAVARGQSHLWQGALPLVACGAGRRAGSCFERRRHHPRLRHRCRTRRRHGLRLRRRQSRRPSTTGACSPGSGVWRGKASPSAASPAAPISSPRPDCSAIAAPHSIGSICRPSARLSPISRWCRLCSRSTATASLARAASPRST